MNSLIKTFAVTLTIPDNEAFTARQTLRHMGFAVGGVRRSAIWIFAVERGAASGLRTAIATLETICNPNKHQLLERASCDPDTGEVWIAARDAAPATTIAGRRIAGVSRIERQTAWQLFDEAGVVVDSAVLDRAIETFLCNPAFQKARR